MQRLWNAAERIGGIEFVGHVPTGEID
jgi:hypothetical protein